MCLWATVSGRWRGFGIHCLSPCIVCNSAIERVILVATRIYIDQGHNPQNPNAGAEGSGYREQDLVYVIGQEFADILRQQGYEVRLSRPTADTQLGTSNATSLAARVNDANSWGADYFISLHANASDIASASGTEALVYRLGTTAARLGQALLTGVTDATGLPDRGVTARPDLYVLRRTRMPAVLMELGFITNAGDAALMADAPRLFAQGLANGLNAFLGGAVAAMAAEPTQDQGGVIEESDAVLSYEEFLAQNPFTGRLRVQTFRGNQAYPVPDARVVISRRFTGGDRVFFEGVTDQSGIIDGIQLPAPPRGDSLSANGPANTAVYDLVATHPSYVTIRTQPEVYEGVTAIQPLQFLLEGV